MSKWIFVTAFPLLVGCASNPYKKFYTNLSGDISKSPAVEISNGIPVILKGQDKQKDFETMLENGYLPVGYSSFSGTDASDREAQSFARELHADTVITYAAYSHTVSGSIPVTTPNVQTSQTFSSGNVYGNGGFANYSGNSYTTTYGSTTNYVPYSVDRYNFFASYWVKGKAPIFGVRALELTPEQKKSISSNRGISVSVVIRNSPAYSADILKGDIIRKMNDIEIDDQTKFGEAIQKLAGQKVLIVFFRDGKSVKKEVQFGQMPILVQTSNEPSEATRTPSGDSK